MNEMPDPSRIKNDFLTQMKAIVEMNLSNEQFGVSELAHEMNMSRSNLLRKVKKETGLSVSQLISQVRLVRGMEMLKSSSLNVSEVAHRVGFASTSYFIKCFREHFGFPPGEVGKREPREVAEEMETESARIHPIFPRKNFFILSFLGVILVFAVGLLVYFIWPSSQPFHLEKSIAVLPFKNDSNDSTNLYLINGLMESTLNNLQKIKDLKVISRTSTEKYRNSSKTIPEMGEELNVNYFVEGSGQKIGDQILLNIQLIEASTDRHLWARQYKREAKDIFQLQQEVAKNIAEEIQAIITPEEKKRIEKNPTENLVAYDLFLKGRDLLNLGGHENLQKSILFFKKAIKHDEEFALAYADAALAFYYMDIFQINKNFTNEINSYADKALLLDPRLAESLVAKAVFYIQKKEFDLAVPYLEKALEYNPNSMLVINFLADFYYMYIPNTSKYLEYALMGVRLEIAPNDSVTASNNFLRLSHALLQAGFIEESNQFAHKSMEYNPGNPISKVLQNWILFFKTKDLNRTKELMILELNKDTTRLDILQEVGKICFYMKSYDEAYHYYSQFIKLKEKYNLNIYTHENLIIGMVLSEAGEADKSREYIESFKEFADNDHSIYKDLYLMAYYSFRGQTQKAIDHLQLFSKQDNFVYYVLLWDMDSGTDPVKEHPQFKKIMAQIETKFWKSHKELRVRLEEKGLI